MHNGRKRKRTTQKDNDEGEDIARGNQTLPVADLPPDFDGIPLDGSQYLAVVR